jgi:hypothetical protein
MSFDPVGERLQLGLLHTSEYCVMWDRRGLGVTHVPEYIGLIEIIT